MGRCRGRGEGRGDGTSRAAGGGREQAADVGARLSGTTVPPAYPRRPIFAITAAAHAPPPRRVIAVHTVIAAISLVGSAFATLSSLYLWAVRFRGERPNLTVHLAGPVGADTLAAGADAPPGTARALFTVKAVVANYSTLPNAVLAVKVWVRAADGGWLPATPSRD